MKNTEHEKKYRRFIIDKSQTSVVPGNHWYTKFLKRHSEKLNSVKRADLEMAKEGERLEKKNRREQLAKEKFDISSALFRTDVAKVKANDYRVVLNYTRKKDESPTKTRLLDMQHQFNSRNCTARMLCFEPSTSPVDTDISSIEETDQLLCDAFDCFVENFDSFDSFVENFDEASNDAINPIFLDMTSFTFENETALPTSNTF